MKKSLVQENKKQWIKKINNDKINQEINNLTDFNLKKFFGKTLAFGTAGLRDEMEWGPGGINIFTIQRAAAAYADYLVEKNPVYLKKGIVIGHDNRHRGIVFSEITAAIFQQRGFKVYLPKDNELKPTPFISYCVNHFKTAGGIVITASHNTKRYNGFKVYDDQGAQCLPNETNRVSEIMSENHDFFNTELKLDKSKVIYFDTDVENEYLDKIITKLQFHKNLERKTFVTFSTMHGTGFPFLTKLLNQMKYKYEYVKEQAIFDPNFSTVVSPNPEIPSSFDMAVDYSNKSNSDVVILVDPDADRIAVRVRHHNKLVALSFNQMAALSLNYYVDNLKKTNQLPKNPYIISSEVSSSFADLVARKNHLEVKKVLIGLKWAGYMIGEDRLKNPNQKSNFVMAYEEAYGGIFIPLTRDKDSFQGACLFLDMINYYQHQGKTLIDVLNETWQEYGYFYSEQRTKIFNGYNVKKEMDEFINEFRKKPLSEINGHKVTKFTDFKKPVFKLGTDNFLKYWIDEDSFVCFRPSGTEPKAKFYSSCVGKSKEEAKRKVTELLDYFIKIT